MTRAGKGKAKVSSGESLIYVKDLLCAFSVTQLCSTPAANKQTPRDQTSLYLKRFLLELPTTLTKSTLKEQAA